MLVPRKCTAILILLAALLWANNAAAQVDCSGGTYDTGVYTTDLIWSGNVCVGDPGRENGTLAMRAATLTIAPGTRVAMCPGCRIQTTSNTAGTLIAEGTAESPIIFERKDPALPWRDLYLQWAFTAETRLRHAVINGAGSQAFPNEAALTVNELGGHPTATPVIDNVVINDSGNYGLRVDLNSSDPTPPSVTNVTINNSAGPAVWVDALGVTALGEGLVLNGNNPDRIEVRNDTVYQDIIWRNHGYPYEVLDTINVRDLDGAGDPTRVTIEAGTTILMSPGASLIIGTLGNANVALEVNGTAEDPVVFDRVDGASGPWGSIAFGLDSTAPIDQRISHAILSYGGGEPTTGTTTAAIRHDGYGNLTLDHVTVQNGGNAAVYIAPAGTLKMLDSRFENNRLGLTTRNFALLRRNSFVNNPGGAVLNLSPGNYCVDAIDNFWGDAGGPLDISNAPDACFGFSTNDGGGDPVSDGVLYRPARTSDTAAFRDLSGISPEPFWVVADGVDEAEVTITVRDDAGNPLPGKQIQLDTTLGSVIQPATPTDSDGQTVAYISGVDSGIATLTARNLTDGVDLGAVAGVTFWAGGLETGGLISSGGTPYLAPQLVIDGAPYEVGFPMSFKLPMRNSNTNPVTVEITYGVSNLGVGALFTDVGTVSRTLAAGEEWDAEVIWQPPSPGHRCVRMTGTFTTVNSKGLTTTKRFSIKGSGLLDSIQKNFDIPEDTPPCDKPSVAKLIPTKGGLRGVVGHIKNAIGQAYLIQQCLNETLTFRRALLPKGGGLRDYQTVVIPAVYTPPAVPVEGDVDAPEAAALDVLGAVAAELVALDEAIVETSRRAVDAGRAGDDSSALVQARAYDGFKLDYAVGLEALAVAIDELLALTRDENEPDEVFLPSDLDAYLLELQTTGYDADTTSYLTAFGRSAAEIDAILADEIALLSSGIPRVTYTLYRYLTQVRDAALDIALDLRREYDPAGSGKGPVPTETLALGLGPITTELEVSHAEATTRTVELVARPVELPIGWTYSLEPTEVTLDPGMTTTVTLSIDATTDLARGGRARIAVEAYVDNNLIGGAMVEKSFPSDTLFEDGFETP